MKEKKQRMKNVWRAEVKEKMRTGEGTGVVGSGVGRKEEKQKRGNLCRFVAQVLHTFARQHLRPCLP